MQKAFKLSLTTSDDPDDNYEIDWIEVETFIIEDKKGGILDISDNAYTPTKGDKFYFLPGVSIPRVKLKDLTTQYGIKSTRSLLDATHVFAGKSTEHKVTETKWLYHVPTEVVQRLYDYTKDKTDGYYSEKLRIALDVNEYDNVFIDWETVNLFRNSKNPIFEEFRSEEDTLKGIRNSHYTTLINDDFVSDVLQIEELQIPILNESELLAHINGEDATTIDESMYEQLKTMLNSTDKDNHILAMEIMANSNYIDSLLFLELLFKEHSYAMEQCRTKNHVNFKGLLAFLGKDKSYMSTNIDQVMKSLYQNSVLTKDKIDYIMDKYSDEIQRNGDSDIFRVQTITLNQEYLEQLNINYKFTVVPEFVPEGSENEHEFNMHDNLHELQHETCEDNNSEEINSNNSNESTTESLEVNEDTTEELEINNNSGDPLETNTTENNANNFDWF